MNQSTRPITTVRTVPAAPIPLWERDQLFVEPTYSDGQSYDQPASDSENEDDRAPAA